MTATTTPSRTSSSRLSEPKLRFSGILHSEWIKITSLRSTFWTLAILVLSSLSLSLLLAFTMEGAGVPDEPSTRFTLPMLTVGVMLGQLVAAVLGVLSASSEYSTGMIQSTLAAVPTRLPVLAAKALVVFALVTGTGALAMFGSWAATYPLFDGLGLAVGLGEPGFTAALLGAALYLGLTAVFALGVGTALRSAAGGIATVLGVLLIVPLALPLLASAIDGLSALTPYLFSNAGEAMARIAEPIQPGQATTAGGLLAPWAGGLTVLAWTLIALVVGAVTLRRRDA